MFTFENTENFTAATAYHFPSHADAQQFAAAHPGTAIYRYDSTLHAVDHAELASGRLDDWDGVDWIVALPGSAGLEDCPDYVRVA